jgi:transposase-like protein
MSYQQWTWKCGDCNQVFSSMTKERAERDFLAHARMHAYAKLREADDAADELEARSPTSGARGVSESPCEHNLTIVRIGEHVDTTQFYSGQTVMFVK